MSDRPLTFRTLTGRSVAEDETRPFSSMPPCGHRCGPEGCLAPGCPVNADAEDLAAAAARCATNGCERLKSRDGLCEPCLEEALNERRDLDFDPERDPW